MSHEIPSECVDLICSGEAVLFVGAGATRAASGPTGGELATLLAATFSRTDIDQSNLGRFADILTSLVERQEIDRCIVDSLKTLQPTPAHRLLPSFVWRAIYTTNYDRLIEIAYDTAPATGRRVQDLRPVLATSDMPSILDPRTVPLFKLHGCISSISHRAPLVLSTQDFARTKKPRARMLRFLRGLAKDHTIIFLGYSFVDGVALELLGQVQEQSPYRRTRRMYAVDPAFVGSTADFLRTRNIDPIPLDMATFFQALDNHLTLEARRRCLGQRIADFETADGRRLNVPPRLLLALDREVESLGADSSGPADAKRFYSGLPPLPGDLRDNHDIERDAEARLMTEIRKAVAGMAAGTDYLRPLVVVLGPGGVGKTTLACRAAHDLAQANEAVAFRLKSEEALWERDDLVRLAQASPLPVIFVVDGLEIHARYMAIKELRHDLSRARVPAVLLASCQKAVWNGYEKSHPAIGAVAFDLEDHLSTAEAEALIDRLSSLAVIGPRTASERTALAEEVLQDYDGNLVVTLNELVRGGSFQRIVLGEYENLTQRAKDAYRYVALLHGHGLSVPDYVLNQVTVRDWALFTNEVVALDADLIIVQDVSSTARRLYFRTRHPMIARIVVDATIPRREDRVQMYRAVVAALGTAREDREFVLRLLTSRQVRDDIGESADIKVMFEIAQDLFPDDRRLLLHLGKFETQYGNYARAREVLEWGRSLEPRDSYLIHQLGVCYEEEGKRMQPGAVRDGTLGEALRLFRQKQELDPLSHYGYTSEARLHLRKAKELGHAAISEAEMEPLSAASDAIRRGLSIVRPDDVGPLRERHVELLALIGEPEAVVQTIRGELERRSVLTYAATYHLLASSLGELGKHEDAIEAIENGLVQFPRDPRLVGLLLEELEGRLYVARYQDLVGKISASAMSYGNLVPKALFAQAVISYYGGRFAEVKQVFERLRESLGHRTPTKIRQWCVDAAGRAVRKRGLCEVDSGRPTMRELDSGLRIGVDEGSWVVAGRPAGEVEYELGFSLAGPRASRLSLPGEST